jgi:TonB-dependent receptor
VSDPDDIQANPQRDELAEYTLDDLAFEDNFTSERDLVAATNLAMPWASGTNGGIARLGLKFRGKKKDRDNNTFVYEGDDIFMADFLDDGFSAGTRIIDGRYTMGPFFSPRDARRLLEQGGLDEEFDHESDGGDYDAGEDLFAGYAMSEVFFGPRLAVIAGARYESTRVDYVGYRVVFDEEGDYATTERLTGDNSYGEILPSVHLRYAISDDQNVRGAITRSLARPNYSDLVPAELVFDEELEIERGNPRLDVTKAWNLDLMYERYFASVGILSAGVFHKRLDDYIYPFRFEEEIRGREYDVLQPLNGDRATLSGVELAYQNRLRFLPPPFDGFGIYANYTWTDSEAEFPDREGAESTLPGQARSIGNLALSYEKRGWSGRIMANYGGKYISEVGESPEEDVYVDGRLQVDFAASYRLRGNMALTLELVNLTNEPFRRYLGTSDRPVQEEYYSWWGMLGLKWSL